MYKKRPALIISNTSFNEHVIVAMITSAKRSAWDHDVLLNKPESAKLKRGSTVRMKLFTLEKDMIIEKIGKLETSDAMLVNDTLKKLFSI